MAARKREELWSPHPQRWESFASLVILAPGLEQKHCRLLRPDSSLNIFFFSQRLEEVQRLLAGSESWPAFLHAGVEANGMWNDCPETVKDALEWMATTTVGLLDTASIGLLTPVCRAFSALIKAAEGTIEVAENLKELISWCSFLVGVFIEHGKHVGDLGPVQKALDEFVSITTELAKRAKVVASRNKCAALLCYRKDARTVEVFAAKLRHVWDNIQGLAILDTRMAVNRLERKLQPRPAPAMADIPAATLTLPTSHVERKGLVCEVVSQITSADGNGVPYVLTGIGGGGKTVLASAVVRNEEVREHFRQGIFWVRVGRGGKDQLQALFEGIARDPSMAPATQQRFNSVDDVIQHLTLVVAEEAKPRLVVLDDVWEREVVDALRPTGLQLLVTTRRSSVVAVHGGRTDVGNMDRGEARELLKKKSGAMALPETEADQVWCRRSPFGWLERSQHNHPSSPLIHLVYRMLSQVAETCGRHALTLAIAGSLEAVTANPNSAPAWHKLHSEIEQRKRTHHGPEMNADNSDDSTKLSLFAVLDMSLVQLGRDERRLFLSLVVLARGVVAPAPMLANLWQKVRSRIVGTIWWATEP